MRRNCRTIYYELVNLVTQRKKIKETNLSAVMKDKRLQAKREPKQLPRHSDRLHCPGERSPQNSWLLVPKLTDL